MMRNQLHKLGVVLLGVVFVSACGDPIQEIEDSNKYSWQRHMNAEEFEQLEEGMTYEEVAQIARGAGEKEDDSTYIWRDEISMTQLYEVTFDNGQLVNKEQQIIHGHSKRGLDAVTEEADGETADAASE